MNRSLKVLIVTMTALAFPLAAHAQSWSTEFGAPPTGKGLDNRALALLEYQGRLIVAGIFSQAGPIAVNRIAAWDGSQWSALGQGLPDTVEELEEFQGDLIAVGGGPPGMLMRWNGSAWSTIPSPPGGAAVFWSVCEYDGSLYVGVTENGISKLAWWDGISWSSIPLPLDSEHEFAKIHAMSVYGGQLFMTGEEPWCCGGFLFAWDGEGFGGPGWVLPGIGTALHVHSGLLYVGGDWYAAPPIPNNGIAIWDQDSWIPFGLSPGVVSDMETYHGRIVMGGLGATSFSGIIYDGQNEQWLGGGCSSTMWVEAVKEFQGDLYVAGGFDEICTDNGRIQASNIARWSEPATAVGSRPVTERELRVESVPNPFNPSVTLTIHVPVKSEVDVAIFDATGRMVRRLASGVQNAGPYHVTWDGVGDDGESLASGLYFARVTAGKSIATAKLVLLK